MNCLSERGTDGWPFLMSSACDSATSPFPVISEQESRQSDCDDLRPTAGLWSRVPTYARIAATVGSAGEAGLRTNS
jgi:hypothetical protein